MTEPGHSPLMPYPALSAELGYPLLVKRDDLLPFPLAGNKVRKVRAELASLDFVPDVIVTTGSANSNHCRTVALLAAEQGSRAVLVVHGHGRNPAGERMLAAAGATVHQVEAAEIGPAMDREAERARATGATVHVIRGGCHTPAGAQAYADAVTECAADLRGVELVVVATGTGATHAGIVAGLARCGLPARVLGVSIARDELRAITAVREALAWCGEAGQPIEVTERYRDDGYGHAGAATLAAVDFGWRRGLPLDPVYTGKAFRPLLDGTVRGRLNGGSVLFWHTGGLANFLLEDQ